MFKRFKLKDIFKLVGGKQPPKEDRFIESSSGLVPAITGVTKNNGIGFYTTKKGKMTYKNIITIAKDGEYAGTVYLQDREVCLAGHSLGLIPKKDIDNKCLLYLASLFINYLKHDYWKINAQIPSVTNDKINSVVIDIPVIENPNPNHKYTVDDIDWQYMRDYIKKLFSDRIKELERDYIKELDAYLQVTGLNDYELTDEDKKVLGGEGEVKCTSFALDKLFAKKTIKGIPKKEENLSANSNGYYIFGQNIKYQYEYRVLMDEKYLQIIKPNRPILAYTSSVGEIGMITESFYRTGDNGAFQGLFPNYDINEYAMRYILTVLQRHFANFGYATSMANIMSLKISLPITQTGEPDFDYMERYIRAIEKVVIADVVKYKDKVIEATKKVVNE